MPLVRIATPSRLHFGLFSFGRPSGRQYGGVGVMVDRPGLRISIERRPGNGGVTAEGPLAARAVRFATACLAAMEADSPEASHTYHVVIESAPPDHVGLGTGTQLALAISAGLCHLNHRDPLAMDAVELARLSGRGERSAIGTHGFLHGGLLLEAGRLPGESLSPLIRRVEFPAEWRFVLIRPSETKGLSGDSEKQAFEGLPPVPEQVTRELCAEAVLNLLPAAIEKNFSEFASSLARYSRLAGECFRRCQGGPFAGEHATRLVDLIRGLGFPGVGQSSWGPTLFVVTPDDGAACQLAEEIRARAEMPVDVVVSAAAGRGAAVE